MSTYSDLYPEDTVLLLTKWLREEASQFNYFVPDDARLKYAIITAQGCGAMGGDPGGGGAIAKSKVPITPGELLLIQVGKCSTASVLGDSFVKRANNTVIVYADRGRGAGPGGLAINSTGDLKKDGYSSSIALPLRGAPSTDELSVESLGFGGFGYQYAQTTLLQAADPGGAGILVPTFSGGNFTGAYATEGAGTGSICIEYYNGDPGPISL